MATKHDFHKAIIGRSELLTFVDLAISGIPAKTDTGAYSSAIHARSITLDPVTGLLSFELLSGHSAFGAHGKHIETAEFKKVIVINSFGHAEKRFSVQFKVKLGPKVFVSHFTLADRSDKNFPILLGRKLISHRFLVDPSETSIDIEQLKHMYGTDRPIDEEERYKPRLTGTTGEA